MTTLPFKDRLVPVTVIKDEKETDNIIGSLYKGGFRTVEIAFRTPCAAAAVKRAAENFPDMIIGAGTVLSRETCLIAAEAGAKFIVSPVFDHKCANECERLKIPYIPGCATPTEIFAARQCGIKLIKFFPAYLYGGPEGIRALSAIFPDVRYMPTGGVDENNLCEYLALSCVAAVGGSFMFKGDITEISARALKKIAAIKEVKQ